MLKKNLTISSLRKYIYFWVEASEKTSKKVNKNKFFIFCDIMFCTFLYSASPNNYYLFGFYNLNHTQRKTFMTHGKIKKLERIYNDKSHLRIFNDKSLFADTYQKYFSRDWLNIRIANFDEFKKFISNKEIIICKPLKSANGRGINKIKKSDFLSIDELYRHIKLPEKNYGIIEEYIVQHTKLNELFSDSVNTVRIVTIVKNSISNVVCAFIRIGNNNCVDNFHSGGLLSPIDINSGTVKSPAIDQYDEIFTHHPISGSKIHEFKIPLWNDVVRVVKEASLVVDKVKYVGWDVAITNCKPIIIEGNPFPGYTALQNPELVENKTGMKALFEVYF